MSVSKRAAGMMLLGAMAACRAVVGIEDQTIATDAGAKDGGSDGATTDAATTADAAADAASKPPITEACRNSQQPQGECIKCCRDLNQPGNAQFDKYLREECLCQRAALCATECAASLCAGIAPPQPPNTCLDCMARNTLTPACANALARCDQDGTCAATSRCLEGTCP